MTVSELVGVYDAEGSLMGELSYAWGKVRGTRHCGLCDITHARVRRKPEWDAMVARLPVPIRVLHLDELDDDLRAAVARTGAPVLLARDAGGDWREAMGAGALDDLGGSVHAFDAAVRAFLAEAGAA
ncbi:hypothetical protein [Nocardioides okcheonensis]|uniref:hypothetical protein n=1 Tax=Nocardioides okcheonensis TaxID=2894081 RepID=UPI001E37FED8|nr:hypothetical protein [Nocardioides okcheonensis]UFN46329.1 hypothetical protein LN652_09045 [Nocardioides okcheonensis]